MPKSTEPLTSGRLLGRNSMWSLIGMVAPMLVALFAVPLLIEGFGKERFGLLSIIWMGIGYFSLFDMGFGRALTKLVSERLGTGDTCDLNSLIWTALTLIFIFGVIGALIVVFGSEFILKNVLNVEQSLQKEGITAFRVLAIGLPVVVVTTAINGILQAYQKFAIITAVRVPLGVVTFGGPLLMVQFSESLIWATLSLVIARAIAFIGFFITTAATCNELKHITLPQKRHIYPLFSFGGWLTVSNVVGPVMVYLDRFLLGSVMTMTAVAYYVTPFEVLRRIQIIPNSMLNVLFPAFTTALNTDKKRLVEIYSQSSRILILLILPVLSATFLFAPEALNIWLGGDFREIATPVVQWLSIGWLINTVARMPFTVLQSAGRPDLTAKTHLSELVPYLIMLWLFTIQFGIAGTAAAWFIRVLFDAVVLNLLAWHKVPELKGAVFENFLMVASLLMVFAVLWLIEPLFIRMIVTIIISIASAIILWPVIKKMAPGLTAKFQKSI
ncbi:MAG TPA: flippase [Flexistipes sinusarabici]|uniref:Flippase n=1 Tax=Flexistipes sinusarabici TaxID=2352 RepID=A0A3D5QBD1_FLESI|nr:flippase [Flexistipes sinusarabici]